MKKIILTLALLFLVSLSTVYAQGSVFNLSMNSNYLFTVQLDNNYISAPNRDFTFQNLSPGSHTLRIYKLKNYGARLIFENRIEIPFNSSVTTLFDRRNFLTTLSIHPLVAPVTSVQLSDCEQYRWNNNQVNSGPGGGNNVYYNQIEPMCGVEFNQFVHTLDNISFDSSRLNVAKQVVGNKYLTTAQVIRIMELFSFDSSKLDFAKFAYGRTIDKSHYFQTFNSLTFDSSVNELSRYISQNG